MLIVYIVLGLAVVVASVVFFSALSFAKRGDVQLRIERGDE